jgi:hypothetical protein
MGHAVNDWLSQLYGVVMFGEYRHEGPLYDDAISLSIARGFVLAEKVVDPRLADRFCLGIMLALAVGVEIELEAQFFPEAAQEVGILA